MGSNLMYTQEKGLSMLSKCHHSSTTSGREKSKGQIVVGGPWEFLKYKIYE